MWDYLSACPDPSQIKQSKPKQNNVQSPSRSEGFRVIFARPKHGSACRGLCLGLTTLVGPFGRWVRAKTQARGSFCNIPKEFLMILSLTGTRWARSGLKTPKSLRVATICSTKNEALVWVLVCTRLQSHRKMQSFSVRLSMASVCVLGDSSAKPQQRSWHLITHPVAILFQA